MKKIEYINYEEIKLTKTGLSLDLTIMAVVGTANGFFWNTFNIMTLNSIEMWYNMSFPFALIIIGCGYFYNRGYKLF